MTILILVDLTIATIIGVLVPGDIWTRLTIAPLGASVVNLGITVYFLIQATRNIRKAERIWASIGKKQA